MKCRQQICRYTQMCKFNRWSNKQHHNRTCSSKLWMRPIDKANATLNGDNTWR